MTIDPFELVRAEEMILGYSCRWWSEPYRVLAVECEFNAPLVNPDTGAESRTFRLGGKMDCLLEEVSTGDVILLESKSTSEDATPGSPYWLRTLMSSQLSTYMVGARSLGYQPKRIVYDVLGRPAHRPLKATPIDSRKYTKKDGRLYDNQRDTDEDPEAFRMRIRESIVENPAKYYNRGTVVRMEVDEKEAAYDAWQIAQNIREGRVAKRFPRNPDACSGGLNAVCTFLPVCSSSADITDPFRYRRVKYEHEELSVPKEDPGEAVSRENGDPVRRLPILTNSQMATFRKCQRLHHFRYDEKVRALGSTEAQRAGTLVHNGLEGWWLGKKDRMSERECLDRALEMIKNGHS